MKNETFEVNTEDGVKLYGILLIPENPKAVVQFNCGTATKKEFYLSFLNYLVENGYICCLWNYRGTHKTERLKNCDYNFSDYGIKDMPAIKSYLQQQFPDLPFLIVAHSAGGQQLGFMKDLSGVKGAINIAVSAGYYPNMPFSYRLKAYFFFYLFSPISILLNGYVKAKPFGFMENLPKKVVAQWRAWCSKPDYFFDKEFYGKMVPEGSFQHFDFPIHVFYSTDDTISNKKNTKAFWSHIKNSQSINFSELNPTDFGLQKIDHFGYFKKNMSKSLWPEIVTILDKFLQ
ncbi:MAG: alpha/beta hydrolase [Pseudopedobacter saltans]|uniref:Alpha/beta hydrolase n=1 Tax=Pseudopedobacter saltans TaxID=151895 RepID=A0A2W5ELY1_9SPHI|nr:MAG: alpha/beta hydrolase [Pseudopedobacter saltans]